ncbi:hypothetical protein BGZ95_010203 [Linnemannia exigua]|uniref:RanBD1 domain-containing protein n=1 Tax=Linnemannia exigua TaxID=604196 RepID=A0AAD4DDD4_9FUNG|nr:hypothetical protein BGZ95_010203 [Linnemannia exigua]
MSKRGTENQLTKDEYDRDGDNDDSSAVMGAFRHASQEEMSKRVIKAPRSRKLNGGGGDDSTAKPSPFANMASFGAPATSTASSSPFANLSLPATTSTTTATATAAASTPAKPFGTFNFGVTPFSTSTTPASTLTSTPAAISSATTSASLFTAGAAKIPSATPLITPGAFTFNVGSKGKNDTTSLALSTSGDADKSETLDREELERYLQALNRTFVKKIEKELVNNPIVNLAQIFGQYTDKRQSIKRKYRNSNDTKSTTSSSANGSLLTTGTSGAATTSLFNSSSFSSTTSTTAAASGADAGPKLSFGLPLSAIGENPAPKPAFGGFNFGVSTTTTTTSTTAGSDTKPTVSAFTTTTTSPFAFSVPKPATSTADATATATSSPFSFSAPKPFGFGLPATSGAPAAGGFQFSLPAAHPSEKKEDGDSEKMPDDTKSQLVDSRAGEEGEETVYEVKAKLYAVVDGENKDLGVGQFRVNENTENKKRRMIMRTGGTGQLILNNWVIQGMVPQRTKNFVTIIAVEDGKPKKFLLKVKEESTAEDVVRELEAGQGK